MLARQLRYTIATFIFLFLHIAADAQITLEPHHVSLKNGVQLDLKIPKGYHISIAAEEMHRLRFLTKSPDGQLFGTDMYNLDDNKKGRIYLFENSTKPLPSLPTACTTQTRLCFIMIKAPITSI